MLRILFAWVLFRRRSTPAEAPVNGEDLLEATLEVAQTQILAQLADETSLDGRTMGVLGFLGALLAADVAAETILGRWWWTPLVGVAIAVIPCLISVFDSDTRMGPPGLTFYAAYGGYPSRPAREQLLADLHDAYEANATRVRLKQKRLRAGPRHHRAWPCGCIANDHVGQAD
jgi:hypothetical protein